MLSALARIATALAMAGQAGSAEEAFRALLTALACCGQRRLMLAAAQLEREVMAGRRAPLDYADLNPAIFDELFEVCDALPPRHWEGEHLDETDRAILASARALGTAITIVTVDLRFLHWVTGKSLSGDAPHVAAIDGLEMLGRLTTCLALSVEVFAVAVDRELVFLDERVGDGTYTEKQAEQRRRSWRNLQHEVSWRLHDADRQGGATWAL